MSKPSEHPNAPRASVAEPSRAREARRLAWAAAVVVAVVGVWLGREGWRSRETPAVRYSKQALLDSLDAAGARGRNDHILQWAERLRALEPDVPMILIGHAMALHDYATGVAPTGRARSALRTSLERIESELRVIAIADSAGKRATTAAEQAAVGQVLGLQFENNGLMVDALVLYTSAFRASGSDAALARRINALVGALRHPHAESAGP